ncbi:MAG: GspE/PulE family protein [Pseudomonadales bacterium]|nr:GspE/PulE family protein [Pseudomonadales bacterium]
MAEQKKIRIGDLLIESGAITEAQLQLALKEQKSSGQRLGRVLTDLNMVDEDQLLNLLSKQLSIPFVDLTRFDFNVDLVRRLPETMARRFRAIVLEDQGKNLLVGMVDPMDIFAVDELSRALKQNVQQAVVREGELLNSLDVIYRRTQEIANLAEELEEDLGEESEIFDINNISTDAEDIPVVKLLQSIFEDAVQIKASDIHIEPGEKELRIRNRVDGVLYEQVMKESRVAAALVLRLKLLSGLNISEKRLPQDGRFNIKVKDKNIDVRLSTMPLQFGEGVVMRLLDQSNNLTDLDVIGMAPKMLARFRNLIHKPHGLVLVTGPTGSGKTTTLYGALDELNTPARKIITAEDPVEYKMPRINQVQIKEDIGLTFASVLRVALRQDPDVLLIGEIRDGESAEIALRASMTGHLVLSTLHTNDALATVIRLVDMGAESYLVAVSLRGVVAQRLIRKNCRYCVEEYIPEASEQDWVTNYLSNRHQNAQQEVTSATKQAALKKAALQQKKFKFKRGVGCSRCNKTGYSGRIGIFELLEINGEMAAAIRQSDVAAFTQLAARDPSFTSLFEAAMTYAVRGLTTLDEVARVAEQVDEKQLPPLSVKTSASATNSTTSGANISNSAAL